MRLAVLEQSDPDCSVLSKWSSGNVPLRRKNARRTPILLEKQYKKVCIDNLHASTADVVHSEFRASTLIVVNAYWRSYETMYTRHTTAQPSIGRKRVWTVLCAALTIDETAYWFLVIYRINSWSVRWTWLSVRKWPRTTVITVCLPLHRRNQHTPMILHRRKHVWRHRS